MNLRQAVLDTMTMSALRQVMQEFSYGNVDLRYRQGMVDSLLRGRRATTELLLRRLSEKQVKRACELVGSPQTGRKRELIEQLLGGENETESAKRGKLNPPKERHSGNREKEQVTGTEAAAVTQAAARGSGTAHTAAIVGYEAQLWQMADALRGSMDAAEYKHVVLGLIFLKYISDAFEEVHARLEAERDQGADPEDADEYRAQDIFWVPADARWANLKAQARQTTIGQLVDDSMEAIERDNPKLKGVLP